MLISKRDMPSCMLSSLKANKCILEEIGAFNRTRRHRTRLKSSKICVSTICQTSSLLKNGRHLRPIGHLIWEILETKVNSFRHISIESLKSNLLREWAALSMGTVRTAIDSWPKRLKAVIKKRRGRFE